MTAGLRPTLIAAVVLLAGAAHGQAVPDPLGRQRAAQALHRQGIAHFNLAEYDRAIALFKDAYALAPAPGLLFNIAQAYRLKGSTGCAAALLFYRNYLRSAPEARAQVEPRIAEMEHCAESLTAGASASQPQPAAASRPFAVAASVPEGRAPPRRWVTFTLGGSGLVSAGVGVLLYGLAGRKYDTLSSQCRDVGCPSSAWTGYRTEERVGIALMVTGATVAAAALAWWLFSPRRTPRRVTLTRSAAMLGGAF